MAATRQEIADIANLYAVEYRPTNREKSMTPKPRGRFWCDHCDRARVGEWEKCPVCRKRSGKRTIRGLFNDC